MKIRFLKAALREFEEAADYHNKVDASLGIRFAVAFDRAVEKMVQRPTARQVIWGSYRRWMLDVFRYAIIYRVDHTEIVVVAFMHLSRDPDYWKRRV